MLLQYISQSLTREIDGAPKLKPMTKEFVDKFYVGMLAMYKPSYANVHKWIKKFRSRLTLEDLSQLSEEKVAMMDRCLETRNEITNAKRLSKYRRNQVINPAMVSNETSIWCE